MSGFQFRVHRAFLRLEDAPGRETVCPQGKAARRWLPVRVSRSKRAVCLWGQAHASETPHLGSLLGRKCAFQAGRTQAASSRWDPVPPP